MALRHTTPRAAALYVHRPGASQESIVHGFLSSHSELNVHMHMFTPLQTPFELQLSGIVHALLSLHAVPAATTTSGGHDACPLHTSRGSHMPLLGRHSR